mmetsp:Transcript_93318/g.168571  ORF Transcript_93318/g.168571 Transcript_93318/m.168571 type:complete len:224 (+) Transcript_93318:538-1209(+)
MHLAVLDYILEVIRRPVLEFHGALQALLVEFIPLILVNDPFLVEVLHDLFNRCVALHIVRLAQSQDLPHVGHGESTVLMEVVPLLRHEVLERSQRSDNPLDVQLELGWWKVEAANDMLSDVLIRMARLEDPTISFAVQELLGGDPELCLHGVQQLQGLLWRREEKPPVWDVVLLWDGIEVAWRKRQEVINNQDVLRQSPQRNLQRETFVCLGDAHQEGAEDVL